jgi:hypothetical protein
MPFRHIDVHTFQSNIIGLESFSDLYSFKTFYRLRKIVWQKILLLFSRIQRLVCEGKKRPCFHICSLVNVVRLIIDHLMS